MLKAEPPMDVALKLEADGWPRDWACKAVEHIEITQNPAGLRHGAQGNQMIRDRLQMQMGLGAVMFFVGLVVSVVTLVNAMHFGGWVVITYGAVFAGGSMWLRAFPLRKQYPDRRIPVYVPPKDFRDHKPAEF